MKKLILIISAFVLCGLSVGPTAEAKTPAAGKNKKQAAMTKKVAKESENGNLGTSFSFDPASVRGKYKMASQGIATVEDEKVLDDLLGLRRHFRDREQQESSRR